MFPSFLDRALRPQTMPRRGNTKYDGQITFKLAKTDELELRRNAALILSDHNIILRELTRAFLDYCGQGLRPVPPFQVAMIADGYRRESGKIIVVPHAADMSRLEETKPAVPPVSQLHRAAQGTSNPAPQSAHSSPTPVLSAPPPKPASPKKNPPS